MPLPPDKETRRRLIREASIATNEEMARLADQKAEKVKCVCSSCEETYYARNKTELYYCPLCGAEQEDEVGDEDTFEEDFGY